MNAGQVTHRIAGFLGFFHLNDILENRNMTFRKLDLFPFSCDGEGHLSWALQKELIAIAKTFRIYLIGQVSFYRRRDRSCQVLTTELKILKFSA
jgi:hypothetical protein